MTAASLDDHPPRYPSSARSLWITTGFAIAALAAGWLIAWVSMMSTQSVTGGGVTLEIPAGWTVLDTAPEQAIAAPSLGSDVRLVVSDAIGADPMDAVVLFVESGPTHFVLFSVDEQTDRAATFRFIQIDPDGNARELMSGRVVFVPKPGGIVSVALFAPSHEFADHLGVLEEAVETIG